ncbi:MAG: dockerin type I domain-containing protein, partial [Verrucomicrobiia bacterium]
NLNYKLTPVLLATASRKTHSAAGAINLTLNLNPVVNPTVEPRKNGPTQLLFTFNKEMMAVDGTLDASEFTLTNATYVSASILSSNLTLNLTNAVDQSKVTVVLNGFSDLEGNALAGTNAVRIRSLYGDANQSGTVNIADMQVIKFKLGSTLSATNFLYDINLSGVINIADMQVVKTMLSHTVPLNSVDSGANSLVTLLNTTLAATADSSVSSVTLGEALGAPELMWNTDGDTVWTATMALDGSLMAWSGSIGHLNVSWVETTVTGPGTLSFQWKVSSEVDADFLTFSIDGVDQPGRLSGEVDWQTLTFSIPSGTHRLTWTYAKNRANAAGVDAGWLRKIVYQRSP